MNSTDNSIEINEEKLLNNNLFIIGFMGVGKTTVSDYLSIILNRHKIDIDKYIEEKENMTISQMFEKYGEDYFRNCETNVLKELNEKSNKIISCGGGIVLRGENIDLMKKQGKIVLLTASAQTIYERVKSSTERPILNINMNVEFISYLIRKREDKYLETADIIINTDNKDIKEISDEIIKKFNEKNNNGEL